MMWKNEWWVMSDELWVMSDGNWVMIFCCPNRLWVSWKSIDMHWWRLPKTSNEDFSLSWLSTLESSYGHFATSSTPNPPPPPRSGAWPPSCLITFNFFPGSLALASKWTGKLLFECLCNWMYALRWMSRHEILILHSIYIHGYKIQIKVRFLNALRNIMLPIRK